MGVVIFWIAGCAVVAWIAAGKGRSAVGFFLLSALLSPVIGLVVVLVMGSKGPAPVFARMKCSRCDKPLSPAWRGKCKHCGAKYEAFPPVAA